MIILLIFFVFAYVFENNCMAVFVYFCWMIILHVLFPALNIFWVDCVYWTPAQLFLSLLDHLEVCGEQPFRWAPALYPDLYTPSSPSWSLHWTYRDEQLVNLPVSLLVEGDVIALRPGQETFASLRGIKVTSLAFSLSFSLSDLTRLGVCFMYRGTWLDYISSRKSLSVFRAISVEYCQWYVMISVSYCFCSLGWWAHCAGARRSLPSVLPPSITPWDWEEGPPQPSAAPALQGGPHTRAQ